MQNSKINLLFISTDALYAPAAAHLLHMRNMRMHVKGEASLNLDEGIVDSSVLFLASELSLSGMEMHLHRRLPTVGTLH